MAVSPRAAWACTHARLCSGSEGHAAEHALAADPNPRACLTPRVLQLLTAHLLPAQHWPAARHSACLLLPPPSCLPPPTLRSWHFLGVRAARSPGAGRCTHPTDPRSNSLGPSPRLTTGPTGWTEDSAGWGGQEAHARAEEGSGSSELR